MKIRTSHWQSLPFALATLAVAMPTFAEDDEAKASIDLRLRYETVDQSNSKKNADALTLRTLVNFKTATYNNFSGFVEFEDSRAVGIDDYNDTIGNNPDYSVIADPETTELDQAYIQYKVNGSGAKVGRQVITFDNQRFIGHVGWRQDKQTFDAAKIFFSNKEIGNFQYAYVNKRNRIFGEEKDIDSQDHLINYSFKTDSGTFSAYGYLFEVDDHTDNGIDTYGLRYKGSRKAGQNKWAYTFEYAMQDSTANGTDYEATYWLAELGYTFNGITVKGGYESLGSDNGEYGFSTPLATLHAFNGWSDQFLTTPDEGLNDVYVHVSGKAWQGNWTVVYHDFSADEASSTVDDLGTELNISYGRKLTKNITGGIKFAFYDAGDSGAGKVDTDKLWVWAQAKF